MHDIMVKDLFENCLNVFWSHVLKPFLHEVDLQFEAKIFFSHFINDLC